jgi:hypothetical protein
MRGNDRLATATAIINGSWIFESTMRVVDHGITWVDPALNWAEP